jgi:lysozyme
MVEGGSAVSDTPIFDLFRRKKREWTKRSAGLTAGDVGEINDALAESRGAKPSPSAGLLSRKGPLAAVVGSLAATSLFATVPKEEGTEYKAYRDIVGVWTVCSGDTNDVHPGLIETPEGCRQRLETQLVAHAKPVMACTPALSEPGRDYQRAAAVSLAYNIGVAAYCRSSADRDFDSGQWRAGCDAFLKWNRAGGRVVAGLTARRQRERAICLRGVA